MDKSAIKKFAIESRNKLRASVIDKAIEFGITEHEIKDPVEVGLDFEIYNTPIGEKRITPIEANQRKSLVKQINYKGFDNVVEEVAYTWFNRLIAIRFMEVNEYLPSGVRVLSSTIDGKLEPEIYSLAPNNGLEFSEEEKMQILELKSLDDNVSQDKLFKLLFIRQCNELNKVLPELFEKTQDYSELLFNLSYIKPGGVIRSLVDDINPDDFKDAVQIIGWMYQYYNTEPKAEVFDRKSGTKIKKEEVPAATQLFTPDWIVRYMVENSLGRLWIEGHPNKDLQDGWRYYLEEANQEPEVLKELEAIREDYKNINPEYIKLIDPCMGSGHILIYAFDVLMQIYETVGYAPRDAAKSIVENNIYGIDIDERAYQLAYFAIMMKGRQYDRRFLTRNISPNVIVINESRGLDYLPDTVGQIKLYDLHKETGNYLIDVFKDAKECGSILNIENRDYDGFIHYINEISDTGATDLFMSGWINKVQESMPSLVKQAKLLSSKYDVVVTNPPYMGGSSMSSTLNDYVKKYYPDSKADFFAVFIEKCGNMTARNRYQAMITQHAWMFLSSFEKLRSKLLLKDTVNMVHLGARAFEEIGGEVVQTTSFVLRNSHIKNAKGVYCRLIKPTSQNGKEDMFLACENRYESSQDNFLKIPGSPIAYWVSETFINTFENKTIRDYGFAGIGMRTGDNERFLRRWHEVSKDRLLIQGKGKEEVKKSGKRWIPYNKGGEFRKWYGNNEYIVNWENDGYEIKENTKQQYPQLGDNLGWKISNENYYFRAGITWSGVTSGAFSCRCYEEGFIFDSGANGLFADTDNLRLYLAALLNSKYANYILKVINPTINTGSGTLNQVPVIWDNARYLMVITDVKKNIDISKLDWDSFETSWEFRKHPLLP